jgi:hypothetical protein
MTYVITSVITTIVTVIVMHSLRQIEIHEKRQASLFEARLKANRIIEIAYNIEITDTERQQQIEEIIRTQNEPT